MSIRWPAARLFVERVDRSADEPDLLSAAARSKYARLSPREYSVLLAAARGAEDKEIAASLGCSISTVRTMWQRVYQKTGLVSRRKIIAVIWEEVVRALIDVVL